MTDEEFIGKHIEVEKSLCEAVKKAKANAKSEVLKALEDVRAEIEADIEFNKDEKGLVNLLGQGKMMAVQIIDRKIAEVTKNE